mmetsp:Transcript_18666/g.53122  ORF Transcript_18666/g.53122 Transcript_18666/m.53122 type:complete len:199 (-) Transcript_18666:132-728(-)
MLGVVADEMGPRRSSDVGLRARSRHTAASLRLRPEPPRPPLRKPVAAHWEVPPLALPEASTMPRAATWSTTSASTAAWGASGEMAELDVSMMARDEEDDEGFVYEMRSGGIASHNGVGEVKQLLGGDPGGCRAGSPVALGAQRVDLRTGACSSSPSPEAAPRRRGGTPPLLGVSPLLLSALEQILAKGPPGHVGALLV